MAKMTPLLVMTLFTLMTLMMKTAGNPTDDKISEEISEVANKLIGKDIEHHSGEKQYSKKQTPLVPVPEDPFPIRKRRCKNYYSKCRITFQCCQPYHCLWVSREQGEPVFNRSKRDTNLRPKKRQNARRPGRPWRNTTFKRCMHQRYPLKFCRDFSDPCRRDEDCCSSTMECRSTGPGLETECYLKPEFNPLLD